MATHRERSRLQRLLYRGQLHRRGVWSYELRHLVSPWLRALCWRHVDRATRSFTGDCPGGRDGRSPGMPVLSTTLREVERPNPEPDIPTRIQSPRHKKLFTRECPGPRAGSHTDQAESEQAPLRGPNTGAGRGLPRAAKHPRRLVSQAPTEASGPNTGAQATSRKERAPNNTRANP